jgi:tRNA (guanine-N7-)-methyltransferase
LIKSKTGVNMRIRRKKHLKERLETVKEILIVPDRDIVNVLEAIKDKRYFDFENIFSNDNPVELEVGCGKGGFIIEKAKRNPNVNYLAVELLENIVVMAAEQAKEQGVKNVRFVNSGAEYLSRYIPDGTISNVYLNFSPPYPNKGYENRRLSCDRRVEDYKKFLKSGGSVFQKTDDKPFFEYSLEKFLEHGFLVKDVSKEIMLNQIDNVQTEYEKKFRALGMNVYGLIATK